MSARRLVRAPLAVASVLLVACGGRPSAPAPPVEIDACELLTPREADSAAGESLQPMAGEVDAARGRHDVKCTYATLDVPPRLVSLEVRRFPTRAAAQGAQASTASYLRSLARGLVEPVAGLGDGAVWAGASVQQLHVLAGRLRLIVTVELGPEANRQAAARTIAERALERLRASKLLDPAGG